MLSDKLNKALSDQVNAEYYSAYLYLVMSAEAANMGLKGASNWLFVQAQEEMAHGTHIFEYILERGAAPSFAAIELPPGGFADITDIYENVLEHELKVTKSINSIASLAMAESDHACYQFMMWYVDEQVEEENNVNEILDKIKLVGAGGSLLQLDNELGTRVFVHPFPVV